MSETKIAWVAQRPLRGNGVDYEIGDIVPADNWPTKLALQRQGYISAVPAVIKTEPESVEESQSQNDKQVEKESETADKYICSICQKEFKNNFGLLGHMRSHNK